MPRKTGHEKQANKQTNKKKTIIFLEHVSNIRNVLSNLAYIPAIETLSLNTQLPEHFKSILQNI